MELQFVKKFKFRSAPSHSQTIIWNTWKHNYDLWDTVVYFDWFSSMHIFVYIVKWIHKKGSTYDLLSDHHWPGNIFCLWYAIWTKSTLFFHPSHTWFLLSYCPLRNAYLHFPRNITCRYSTSYFFLFKNYYMILERWLSS